MKDRKIKTNEVASIKSRLSKNPKFKNIVVSANKSSNQLKKEVVQVVNPNFDENVIDLLLTPRK